MNKNNKGTQTSVFTVTQLPLYKKALEICNLSFSLRSVYASKVSSEDCSSTNLISDHHLEELVITAIGLPQTIAKASVTKDMFAHHSFYNYMQTTTKQVKHHLRMLRKQKPHEASQCSALARALKEFVRLQDQWTVLKLNKN
tara:strand:+ start:776 stop:1201 length:426 start_codon:yes stop_codon:yes gene_type:complete